MTTISRNPSSSRSLGLQSRNLVVLGLEVRELPSLHAPVVRFFSLRCFCSARPACSFNSPSVTKQDPVLENGIPERSACIRARGVPKRRRNSVQRRAPWSAECRLWRSPTTPDGASRPLTLRRGRRYHRGLWPVSTRPPRQEQLRASGSLHSTTCSLLLALNLMRGGAADACGREGESTPRADEHVRHL